MYDRENILLSYDYKRSQDSYQREEIQDFLDKLDKEEIQISALFKN